MAKLASLDDLRSKKPVITSVTIAFDSEVAERHDKAKRAYEFARLRHQTSPDDMALLDNFNSAADEFAEAEEIMEKVAYRFSFVAIGRGPYEELLLKHGPTKEQKEKARKLGNPNLTWNTDTFPPALISISSYQPKLTPEEVKELWESPDWNQAELMAMFQAALDANQERQIPDLGKG